MRVAVLEDDISQLELMSHWVRMAGHSTHTFQHGEGLLRELVHESFDALLLDWNVPDISGIEVLRRVRRESTVPVLFCTGRGDESDVVAYSTQIDHRFHGDCDQSFHSKAISGSTSKRSVIRCPAVREDGRYSAVSV